MSLPSSYQRNILHWIHQCDRLQPDCPPMPNQNRPPHEIPSWVIDIQEGRIVEGATAPRYVALSYVWPAMNANETTLELRTDNLKEAQKAGFLRDVSMDRSSLHRARWRHEALEIENMDSIYSGAYFTVIAAASTGLYGELKPQSQHIPAALSSRASPASLYDQLLESKWATRGWTLQEQILSRRCVIFIDGDVFWDCGRCLWIGDSPEPEAKANRGVEKFPQELGHEMPVTVPLSSIVFADFKLYRDFVCLYNGRHLIYPQDILRAFGASSVRFHVPFPGKRRTTTQKRAEDMDMPRENLPSWSWCGWQVIVDPWSLCVRSLEWLRPELRTWQLVQWSLLSGDLEHEEMLTGPAVLEDHCRRFLDGNDVMDFHPGWSRHSIRDLPRDKTGAYHGKEPAAIDSSHRYAFTHFAEPTKLVSHLIPTIDPVRKPSTAFRNWPYLCCETATGTFKVELILSVWGIWFILIQYQSVKVSVTSLEKFRRGTSQTKAPDSPHDNQQICFIVTLVDASGRPAGLLRMMDKTKIEPGQEMELMAISSGAMARDQLFL
ncbi:hypothetical protein QBC40DRAFT_350608 [Triangularia verruculosa]|uniref:Heterokaryon incompatibility domain-containing protein n=1 Tax=Triangularia verruculosa TaxID=2587418 RepID=A0AAN7ASN7_9PEZI|nr:hypothetical protein QBC40DRAFT_350608 [Triangularia verruculosa]